MNAPEVKRLIDQVPRSIRFAVLDSGEFQQLTSDFVRAHVQTRASELVDRLRNAQGFEDELEKLNPQPDYLQGCADNDVEIVDDDGTFYTFNWNDLATIEVGDDGKGFIDFPRFAQDQGLDLSLWAWNTLEEEPILRADVTDENADDVDTERSVLAGLIEATASVDATEVVDALAAIARHDGKDQLAAALKNDAKRKDLLQGYVVPNSTLCLNEFLTKEDAARHACDAYGIEPDYREVYEYWVVDDTLAYQLAEHGELVERDFVGLTIWGRCTTGQSIAIDGVMAGIVKEWYADEVDAMVLKQFPNVGKHDENLIGVPVDMLAALESDRVVRVDYTYTSHGAEHSDGVDLVLSSQDETKAWRVESLRDGKKHGTTAGEPLPVAEIKASILAWGEPAGPGLVSRGPNQEDVDYAVRGIARFHEMNASSPMHQVPENLQERLSKLSPAYAAERAAENNGPSLG